MSVIRTAARAMIVDAWSAISHKQPMSDAPAAQVESRVNGWSPNSWTGEEHQRRLTSYMILSAYDKNVARGFLATTDQEDRDERREYGDAGLIIDQTLAHLLGESQEIVVPGADLYDAELDEAPEDGEDDRDPAEVTANNEYRALAQLEEFIRGWADDVHLTLRLTDCERNAVGLGDGVYLLGWDARRERPTCAVMDPGFYFPVLPDTLDSYDYPERVHFAWEIPAEDFDDNKARVRRITYELATLQPVLDEDAYLRATTDQERDAAFTLPDGARWETKTDELGTYRRVVRQYPWDDEPSERVCLVSDVTWILDDLKEARSVDTFDLDASVGAPRTDEQGREVLRLDTGLDFLPVVHIPNTPPGGDHYGQSSLARVLQLLDDIQNADTDSSMASATTGSPIVVVSGSATQGENVLTGQRGKPMDVRPGEVWKVGENGGATTIDTSANLAALREYVTQLLERLSVNARLPAAVLGRLKPSEVPSGFAMQLSFGPLSSMIRTMRLVRSVKYPLLLKMVLRLYQANGALPPGATPRVELALGAFLPSDMSGTLSSVKDAYGAKLISLETAVTMLLAVGFPIDDVAEEIARIESRDFEGANALADLGDVDEARKYLGLDPLTQPTGEPAPAPIVPPASGGAGAGGGA